MATNFFTKFIHIEKNKLNSAFLLFKLPYSFWLTLAVIAGILFSYYHLYPLLILSATGCYFAKKSSSKSFPILFFIFLGYGMHTFHSLQKLPLPLLKDTVIQGKVTDKAFTDNSFWKHRIRLEVFNIESKSGWVPTSFTLYVYSKKHFYGRVQDIVECGPLTINQPTDKGFTLYLKREGVSATAFPQQLRYKIKGRPKFSFLNWLFWQRELIQIKLRKKLSRETFSLFSSLFVGNRKPVMTALSPHKQHFKKWGILHHLARSGLHLVVFIMIWHYLLNALPLSFNKKHGILSFLILFYFLFSWSSLSFARAFIVYVFYKIGVLTQSKVHPLHAICSACLMLLLYNPFHLFFLDFQLSFLLSFFLLWITHVDHQRNIMQYKSLAEEKRKDLS